MTLQEMLAEKMREEGRVEGRRDALREQLSVQFGELDDAALARIDAASPDQLDRWLTAVPKAESLEDIWG